MVEELPKEVEQQGQMPEIGVCGCVWHGKETREAAVEGGKEFIDVARGWGGLARTLNFTLSEMRSHWWVWGRGVILSDFVLKLIPLAVMWKIN